MYISTNLLLRICKNIILYIIREKILPSINQNMENVTKPFLGAIQKSFFKKDFKKYRKWFLYGEIIGILMILTITWSFSMNRSLVSDLESLRTSLWANLFIITVHMDLTWLLAIYKVNPSSWSEIYFFLAGVFILNMGYAGIEIYMSKWTFIPVSLLVLLSVTLMCALLTLCGRYIENCFKNEFTEKLLKCRCAKWITTFIRLIKGLSVGVITVLIIFQTTLVFCEPYDEEGHRGLLSVFLYVVPLGLVTQCDTNDLRKKKIICMNAVLSTCCIVFLLLEVANKMFLKGWSNETITLLCLSIVLIVFIYTPTVCLHIKKLLANRQTWNEDIDNRSDCESV
ncbi:uncharacterized protein [Euwallacea similis]|uniref:uncharacterized protein n=1 Tax=Euwallacea similis TaxID=1736056 RepID=UPI00344E6E5F